MSYMRVCVNRNIYFYIFNPFALRMTRTLWWFGRSECNNVKVNQYTAILKGNNIFDALLGFSPPNRESSLKGLKVKILL